jgi:hypothetical protein
VRADWEYLRNVVEAVDGVESGAVLLKHAVALLEIDLGELAVWVKRGRGGGAGEGFVRAMDVMIARFRGMLIAE